MDAIQLPSDVLEFLTKVFSQCNRAVTRKISKMPTTYETSLDHTFIDQLSNYAAPARFPSGWMVRIDTHYLGGGRHFLRSWEIADIGVLVTYRRAGKLVRSKVALLQCKRLYPVETETNEDEKTNYITGFGRFFESDESYLSVVEPRRFEFNQSSEYKALQKGNDQYEHIDAFESHTSVPVHYMFYHPLRLPFYASIPRTTTRNPRGPNRVGCRIVKSDSLRQALAGFAPGRVPRYGDLKILLPEPYDSVEHEVGWRLEHFIAHLLVTCEEGYIARGRFDDGLNAVFSERTGPIAAAVGVTFDAPE